MFINAIARAAEFTRPIHFITRRLGSPDVLPGAGTLFFVNADGWALTCKHVAQELVGADQLRTRYAAFKAERAAIPGGQTSRQPFRELERHYGFTAASTVESLNSFVGCVEGTVEIDLRMHATLDVALLHFRNFTRLLCTAFPVFAADGRLLRQGKSLCRLGFPFPEFNNFEYDAQADEIRWTSAGRAQSPQFPIDGMVTRHLGDASGQITGFEMSTPGLRGQSGGPAFDVDGRVWGMQSATNHLDLDFDVDLDVLRSGVSRRVKDSAFLHVGHCLHVDVLKQFMHEHGVRFGEA